MTALPLVYSPGILWYFPRGPINEEVTCTCDLWGFEGALCVYEHGFSSSRLCFYFVGWFVSLHICLWWPLTFHMWFGAAQIWCSLFVPDDDWQEEHKRLAELDERDELGAGLGFGGGGMGRDSDLSTSERPSSTRIPSSVVHPPPPSSLASLSFSSSSSRLPPSGRWCHQTLKHQVEIGIF